MMRPLRAAAMLLPALALAGCLGQPMKPGQFTQACANTVLHSGAPPPAYVRVSRDAVRAEHDAYFVNGRVALTRMAGPKTGRHEAARQAAFDLGRQPTPREFRDVERRCGASGRRPRY